jgi:hypothetical protein
VPSEKYRTTVREIGSSGAFHRRSRRPLEPPHAAYVDGLLLALEHNQLGHADRSGDEASQPCGKQHLATGRVGLEARRRVDNVPDGGEVVHGGVSDVADERLAEVEPDTDREVRFAR